MRNGIQRCEPFRHEDHLLSLARRRGMRETTVHVHEHIDRHSSGAQRQVGMTGQGRFKRRQQVRQQPFEPVASASHPSHCFCGQSTRRGAHEVCIFQNLFDDLPQRQNSHVGIRGLGGQGRSSIRDTRFFTQQPAAPQLLQQTHLIPERCGA